MLHLQYNLNEMMYDLLQVNIDIDSWVRKLPLDSKDFLLPNEEDRDQLESICLYEVLG